MKKTVYVKRDCNGKSLYYVQNFSMDRLIRIAEAKALTMINNGSFVRHTSESSTAILRGAK